MRNLKGGEKVGGKPFLDSFNDLEVAMTSKQSRSQWLNLEHPTGKTFTCGRVANYPRG